MRIIFVQTFCMLTRGAKVKLHFIKYWSLRLIVIMTWKFCKLWWLNRTKDKIRKYTVEAQVTNNSYSIWLTNQYELYMSKETFNNFVIGIIIEGQVMIDVWLSNEPFDENYPLFVFMLKDNMITMVLLYCTL